jgi:hypothetical protein
MASFRWSRGGIPVSADIAAAELSRLERIHGYLSPEIVVDASRPENAPLHPCFDWDNDTAADKFRIVQAYYILRCLREIRETADGDRIEVRALIAVSPSSAPEDAFITGKVKNLTIVDDDEEPEIEVGEDGRVKAKNRLLYISLSRVLGHDAAVADMLEQAKSDMRKFITKYCHLAELAGVIDAMKKALRDLLEGAA